MKRSRLPTHRPPCDANPIVPSLPSVRSAVRRSRWVILAFGIAACSSFARADEVETCARAAERAQQLRDDDRFVEARDQLRSCAREACPSVIRNDCRTWLTEVEALVPSLVIYADGSDGRALYDVVLRDGDRVIAARLDGKPIELDPGVHELTFTSEGYEPLTMEVVIRTGEKNRDLRVELRSKHATTKPAVRETGATEGAGVVPWVLVGFGVAAVGTGTYLGLDARADVSDMRDTCAPSCPSSDVDRARTQLLLADVALGVGVVSAGIGTWLLLGDQQEQPPASLTVGAGPKGATALWTHAF